jgi:hypothetical protein
MALVIGLVTAALMVGAGLLDLAPMASATGVPGVRLHEEAMLVPSPPPL